MKWLRWIILAGITLILANAAFAATESPEAGNEPQKAPSEDTFRVLDISERTYENGPAIAILLSAPLDATLRHDVHIRISDTQNLLKSAWVLSENGRTLWFPYAEPETQYSVTVLETLASADGRTLGDRVSQTVTTRSVTPIVSFASEGYLLPSDGSRGLPVVSVNIPSVYVEFFRLRPKGLVQFINWRNTTGEKSYYKLADARKYGKMVYSGRFDLNVPKNRRTVVHIPIHDIEALTPPGVYMAVMREPGQYDYTYQGTYFLVTDIGLHVRSYPKESLIFASSLKTGKPLPGLKIRCWDNEGKTVAKGLTDADGHLSLSRTLPGKVRIITASSETQMGVLPLNIPALDMSEFDLGKRRFRNREIFIYSPRDLYRPGETLTVSALLRDADGKPLEALPLKARLYRPDRKAARNFTWKPEPLEKEGMNYYETRIRIPSDAPTGKWLLKLWDDPGAKKSAAEYAFQIEEFLPERMKLDLAARPAFPGPEENLLVDIEGRYLYGAPAGGNQVGVRVRVKANRNPLEALKDFQFGNADDADFRDYWEESEEKLDDRGLKTVEISSGWASVRSPLSVRVVIDLFETGGRPVTRAVDKTVWPAGQLIGIRPLFDTDSTDAGPVRFEVVKADTEGKMLAGEGVIAELTREDRDYYWEYSESNGWEYKFNQKNYLFLTDGLSLEAGKPTPYSLHLGDGQYLLSVTDPETRVKTSLRFRVGHWWYPSDGESAARPDKVVLNLNQTAYRPGDVIRLTVTPPHPGEALITVEGERPLWMKRLPVDGDGTEVEIPMLAGWETHNLYISAVVFRPASAREKITPNRAVGLIHLPLDRTKRKLAVQMEAPEKTAPEGPLTAHLKISGAGEASGQVYVTLAAVDVGILNITDFKTPDPFTWYFEPRRYGVDSYDAYAKVIEPFEGGAASLRYGGDADLAGGKRPENSVRLLSLFRSPVMLDENGETDVTFQLPDFNGRLRLMAVAFDTERFGSSEADVTVAAPIVTQLAMPRFLAPGDASEFTLDVHNLSGETRELSLLMAAEGPADLSEGERRLTLEDQKKTALRFPVKADADYGTAKVFLELTAGDVQLDRNWQIPVRPGYPGTARKVLEIVHPGGTFSLDPALAEDLIPATAGGEIKISARPPLNFQNAMKGLLTYPYGCLEQTASRAHPLLFATPENIARFSLPVVTAEERVKRIQTAISRLGTMQLASGGFGLWSKSSPEAHWLTVFAADFLSSARDLGFDVPAGMLDKAMKRLEKYLTRSASLDDYYMDNEDREKVDFAVRCYAGYVLSRVNRAPLGTLRPLFDNHADLSASSLPLAHLGAALTRMGDADRGRRAFASAVTRRCSRYGYWGDYSSLVRDLGLTLALFAEMNASDAEGFDTMLLDLDKAVRQRRWMSTQEKYAIFRAGMALNQGDQRQWKGTLAAGAEPMPLDMNGEFYRKLSGSDISAGVGFTSQDTQRLYVSALVNGYTKEPPLKEDDRISLFREMFSLKGEPVEPRDFFVGELFLVHLRVAAKERIPDGLVVDLLPAGFEIENQNLKHSFKMEDMTIEGRSIWKLREQAQILHEEYRDDRYVAAVMLDTYRPAHLFYLVRVVSPGTFSAPPVFAESMYRPEIRGIGEAQEAVTVVNKNVAGE